jgi:ABC-type multidrug transport system ATPase subunit/transcriptional regulator with XRE-family HTH domain
MQDKNYHSGLKLRALREIKGLKEKELAEVLGCQFESIVLWEEEGVPWSELPSILEFFEVNKNMFSAEVLSDAMLRKLAISELKRTALDKELSERLDIYGSEGAVELDLSSLGLLTVPAAVFNLSGLRKVDLSDNLLSEIPANLQKLIDEKCELIIRNNFIDSDLPNTYNTVSKLVDEQPIQEDVFIEKIRLVQLRLEHIGIYEDLTIDFNDELTVLIGVNGAGKTTILKSLSLAILGARESVNSKAVSLRNLDIPNEVDSKITLKATVDSIEFSNQIVLSHDNDTGETHVIGNPFEPLFRTPSTLKNLILCLGEQRNNSSGNAKQKLDSDPRILDLLPLLRGEDQSCIKDFTSWWANLENSKITQPDDQDIINLCFEIFSKFMGEQIQSLGLKQVEPNTELWIQYETGKSTPLYLASQGYQTVMGWVGFVIQRMVEANERYPLPLSQPSIVIIDEIDQLLSVKWQQNILSILREFFPNTQWIISTHSPMVLTDLDKHQVVQLHERDGTIVADANKVDLWMWQYGDIIRRYFEIASTPPKFQEQLIVDQIGSIMKRDEKSGHNSELEKLNNRLERVRDSSAAVDKFEAQLQSLKKREQQLVDLMNELGNESN